MPKVKVNTNLGGSKEVSKRVEGIISKLRDLQYEVSLGTLNMNQTHWINVLQWNLRRRGDLTPREFEVLNSMYEEVFR